MTHRTLVAATLVAALILTAGAPMALAADVDGPSCSDAQELDKYRLLRRLSLDLRNHLPTYEELLALDAEDGVPDALVDEMIASDAFRLAMRRFHEKLFWPNVSNVQLNGVGQRLIQDYSGTYYVRAAQKQKKFRNDADAKCGNFEQTEFDPVDGSPIANELPNDSGPDPILQDGWVKVAPYWAPGTEIKVCAFDAQDAVTVDGGVDCGSSQGQAHPKCGCGPELRYCFGDDSMASIRDSMREQLLRLVDEVTVGGAPYSDLVATRRVDMNGPLDHFKKYLSPLFNPTKTMDIYTEADGPLPESPVFSDDSWETRERLAPHAGIQTMPAFTLRFQTNRGRANRFRIVFTDQYFLPGSGEVDESACDPTAEDLTERCVCQDCHQVLEPLAAYFAPIAEAGSADVTPYPIYDEKCDPKFEGQPMAFTCNRFYVTEWGAHRTGWLRTHQWADVEDPLHGQIAAHIEEGPMGFAETVLGTGLFHSSIVRHLWRHLMARDPNLDATDPDNELALLDEITTEFAGTDDLRAVVKTLVGLPQYRRVH